MPLRDERRVFISYARSDGAEYAAHLRQRLEREHPEITLWQDVISERAGKDWWLQITEVLDNVAYMVLVATPDAMQSEAVRKEWRYARQQGVCVLPVQASDVIDFDSLPRWMRTQQFANLKIKEQWNNFISDLHRPCQTPRVPFMAEDLPKDFIARPEEFEPLIQLLLDKKREQRNPVAITTAMRGAGGFGKTTLAKAVCHDDRIQEVFDDGVLWVTLGEKVDNLVGKVAELTTTLSGERSDFGSLVPAVTRLRELLADRDILMVIDDVWDPTHLEPFLQGGPYCARLITTRNLDTLPEQCPDIKVDSMQPAEAAALLGARLPEECRPQIVALAERVGNWPLLLGIVKGVLQGRVESAHQPLPEAIAYVNKALDKRGLTAFDRGNSQARNRAVALTIAVSLEHFSQDVHERQRFEELSIFPEDVDIPLKVIEALWQATGGLDDFEIEDLCGRLHSRSLLQALDLSARQLRLHDVMRSYLKAELDRHGDPKLVHSKLVDAWGDPLNLPGNYAWRWYAYHLVGAGREAELAGLLLCPVWLQAKLDATDVTSLATDFDRLPEDEDLRLVHGAIRLSSNVIGRDHGQFASQMVGRLLWYRHIPALEWFTAGVVEGTPTPWLRPLQPALHPPGTSLIRTLEGHRDAVHAVVLSGDGRRAVSVSDDKTLKVWDVESGRELRTLQGHSGSVKGVALSGDGRLAVSASSDQTLKVWEVESGRELRTLIGHEGGVNAVAMTADGRRAVSASDDQTLKVWEVESGRELRTLQGHSDAVFGVALSGDGRLVVSASSDQTLKVWEVESGRELHTLEGHHSSVRCVAVSGNGQLAVSVSWDNTVKVWEVESGRELRTLQGHTREVDGVALSGDGRLAVSASFDNTLKVWEVTSGRELRTLRGHSSWVHGVALSGDGRLSVSASADHTLKVWQVGSGREPRILRGHSYWVNGMAVSGDGRVAVSASWDHTLKVWDVRSGRELRSLQGHFDGVSAVALSRDGRLAVSASLDQTVRVWEVGSGRELRTLTGHTGGVTGVALIGNGRLAVSASADETLKVWHLASGHELHTLRGHSDAVIGVAVSGDGRVAISASGDKTLKVWHVDSGSELLTLRGHSGAVFGVAMSGDGRRAVSASEDQTLKVWDVDMGNQLSVLEGPFAGFVVPETAKLETAKAVNLNPFYKGPLTYKGPLGWYKARGTEGGHEAPELEGGHEARTLTGHSGSVTAVAVTLDGQRAVSASFDQTLRVWELATGKVLATFTCDGPATSCVFMSDREIIAGDAGGRVHFLRLEEPKAKS